MQKEELANLIDNGSCCCAVKKGDEIITSNANGIKPLFQWLKADCDFLVGCDVADKIIGKAAALLLVLGKAKSVYAKIISDSAISVLEEYKIPYSYSKRVEFISNRTNTGMCPMEETVFNISNPNEAFDALKQKIDELMSKK